MVFFFCVFDKSYSRIIIFGLGFVIRHLRKITENFRFDDMNLEIYTCILHITLSNFILDSSGHVLILFLLFMVTGDSLRLSRRITFL